MYTLSSKKLGGALSGLAMGIVLVAFSSCHFQEVDPITLYSLRSFNSVEEIDKFFRDKRITIKRQLIPAGNENWCGIVAYLQSGTGQTFAFGFVERETKWYIRGISWINETDPNNVGWSAKDNELELNHRGKTLIRMAPDLY